MSKVAPPTEEVVKALLDYLVDPMLPLKASSKNPPSLDNQNSVAKQMHAVVLLYNYYHRMPHPELRFLEYEQFCQLALELKPVLTAHMNVAHGTTPPDHLRNHLSITEKAIMDACNISLSLNSLRDVQNAEAWPIAKVSVLLVDSKKENCLLLYSSMTNGVWSVVEESLDVSNQESEIPLERIASKTMRESKRTPKDEIDANSGFEHLAFAAVEKTTGIHQSELMVLERHVVYSLSKEKTAAYFYIMEYTQSSKEFEVPIRDAIESLQGPLLKWMSGSWTLTQVVEYYHVLPYAKIMSSWYSREVVSNDSASLHISSFEKGNKICGGKIAENEQAFLNDKIAESEQAFLNNPQNFDVGSFTLANTCGAEINKPLNIYDPSYSDTRSCCNESMIVEEEVQEVGNACGSVTKESCLIADKEAQEIMIPHKSCDVARPMLEKFEIGVAAHRSGGEIVGTCDLKLREVEKEKSCKPWEIIQPKLEQFENCIDLPSTSKETIDSENFKMGKIEMEETEKSNESLDITQPTIGYCDARSCCSEPIADEIFNIADKEVLEMGNASEFVAKESCSIVDKEAPEMIISDKSCDVIYKTLEKFKNGVSVGCSGRETIGTGNSKLRETESESEGKEKSCKPWEIIQPKVEQFKDCIDSPCTGKETINSENFKMGGELEIEEAEKSDKSLDIILPTIEQPEIVSCCKETMNTAECHRGEKEVEGTENSNKLSDINHTAVKNLEDGVFPYIGEGTICTGNSERVDEEVEDMRRSYTCSKISHLSVKEVGNTVNANYRGKLTICDEKITRQAENTENSNEFLDGENLTVKKLSSNHFEDSKQHPYDFQIIQYPQRKSQKITFDRFKVHLRNSCKTKDAEVPIRYYHRKRKIASPSSLTGTGLYARTTVTSNSFSGQYREGTVTEDSINGSIQANPHGTSLADCVLADKDSALTRTALGVLFNKRAKLCQQQRDLQDEVALYDRNIQKILEGKDDALAIKLDTIMDGCKDMLQGE